VVVPRQTAAGLLAFGAVALAGAVAWWIDSFRLVLWYDYLSVPQAATCLVYESTICELAISLCNARHRFGVPGYSSNLAWIAIAALSMALALDPRASR
jgi:hypothetical protein